jgi:hypothetical protein
LCIYFLLPPVPPSKVSLGERCAPKLLFLSFRSDSKFLTTIIVSYAPVKSYPCFIQLGTRWGWVVSITSQPRFTPGERTPGTHWTGDWVGPRAGLDAEARRKILCFCRGSNPGRPVRSQSLYWLSYPGSFGTTWRWLSSFTLRLLYSPVPVG